MERCSSDLEFRFEEFLLKEPIWSIIKKLTQTSGERSIIKKAIGESLVDETLELQKEVATLYEIWKEFHEQTTNKVCQPALPEPPLMRENLEKQISLLVDLLQQKIARHGGRPMSTLLTDTERDVVKSVSGVARKKRCSSIDSLKQRDTPSSGYSSRTTSSLSIDLNVLEDNINIMEIDLIIQPLREEFENERKQLLSDIKYIQDALIYENEKEYLKNNPESPTLTDLRKLSSKLEKEVLYDDVLESSKSPNEKSITTFNSKHVLVSRSPGSQQKKKSLKNMEKQQPHHVNGSGSDSSEKVLNARLFEYPEDISNSSAENSTRPRKKLTPSPPVGERTNYKLNSVAVSKFRRHVSPQKEVVS